ncbi:tannase/feruloyl esterase family alpha/beta hydrolase [Sphingomonas sp. MMS24-J13]|uniref:tannase/feruloyl esterase family alpha/beta hydrolase n=1 Tax=Sphingomonas sp. MMS24-J13 TaxID=3238686 RepID=UPI00384DD2F2
MAADRRSGHWWIFGHGIAAMALALLLPSTVRAQANARGDVERCAALRATSIDGAVIDEAALSTSAPPPAGASGQGAAPIVLPRHCLVRGTINRRIGAGGRAYGIGFELRLPVDWNGRFLFQGGAGLDGVVAPAIGVIPNSAQPPALVGGFAVVSTDAGHQGSPVDASFAVDQQARIDYGYNALDKVTLAAKALIARYYGKPPVRSYMVGCSNGGRQALTVSQRLPLYFDGIVAGDPTLRFSRVTLAEVSNLHALARIAPKDGQGQPIYARAFSDGDLQLVRAAVLRRCDAKDGLSDGFINDWRRCDFDPGVLSCRGAKAASCLSPAQVAVLRDLHRGPRDRDGNALYGAFNYDTGIASSAWRGMRLGSGQGKPADATLGLGAFKYLHLTPPDPAFGPETPIDYGEVVERLRHTAALTDADNPFLGSFAGHGKMIVYNGLSDQGLASNVVAAWYDQMVASTGPSGREAVSLFLVPGMLHCGGGEATDQFDMLDAIMRWVEQGQAPARILAGSRKFPAVQRPLCPYPTIARYVGGDVNAADSFACRL